MHGESNNPWGGERWGMFPCKEAWGNKGGHAVGGVGINNVGGEEREPGTK